MTVLDKTIDSYPPILSAFVSTNNSLKYRAKNSEGAHFIVGNMVRSGERSAEERLRILERRKEGYSLSSIAKDFKLSKAGVKKICDRIEQRGFAESMPRTGRKCKMTPRQDGHIVREVKRNPLITTREIKENLELPIGLTQIKKRLSEAGFHGRVCRRKPFISKKNALKRLQFAIKYLKKPIEFWESTIWSDESKFEIFNTNRRRYVWRKNSESFKKGHVKTVIKHGGGSIMTWGCFSKHSVGNLVIIDGKLTAVKYIEILQNNLFDSTQKMGLERGYVFQQDNDPKHKAKITTKFLEDNNITILDFPPQSPDLNPIEHLWDHLKRNVAVTERTNKTIFINALYKEWNNMSLNTIKKLIQNIPNRLQAVIAAKGYHTKY